MKETWRIESKVQVQSNRLFTPESTRQNKRSCEAHLWNTVFDSSHSIRIWIRFWGRDGRCSAGVFGHDLGMIFKDENNFLNEWSRIGTLTLSISMCSGWWVKYKNICQRRWFGSISIPTGFCAYQLDSPIGMCACCRFVFLNWHWPSIDYDRQSTIIDRTAKISNNIILHVYTCFISTTKRVQTSIL